jgi:hypothetical protein
MKLSLRLIPILAIAITLVTFVVARNQVRSEKRGLRADLERRAEILAESLQETVEPVLQRGPLTNSDELWSDSGTGNILWEWLSMPMTEKNWP